MATDFDTVATDFVAQNGAGTYECDACGQDIFVTGNPDDAVSNRVHAKHLILHVRFDHLTPADILQVQHTVVLRTLGL